MAPFIWTNDELSKIDEIFKNRPFTKVPELFKLIFLEPINRTLYSNLEPINLFYKLSDNDGKAEGQTIKFVTTDVTDGLYRGVSIRNIYESDYITKSRFIMTAIGYRTGRDEVLKLPAVYSETISILDTTQNSNDPDLNFINITQTYQDDGLSVATTQPFVNFLVTSSSGIFKYYTKALIKYDNDSGKREIIITN